MKVLVTGVGGQLGHDVMNELASRGYEGIGSDIKETYSGIQDCTAVTTMPYVPMDITDAASVEKVLTEAAPDVVVHCAAWTAVDLAEDEDKKDIEKLSMQQEQRILQMYARNWTVRWFTSAQTMYSTDRERKHGNRIAKITNL